MRKIVLLMIVATAFYFGCTKMASETVSEDPQVNCTPQFPDKNVTYNNYVKGIVTHYCTDGCHQGGNTPGPGNFSTYSGIQPYTGDIFYFRVIQDRADMPQDNAPLPKSIRDSLNFWIKNCSPEK